MRTAARCALVVFLVATLVSCSSDPQETTAAVPDLPTIQPGVLQACIAPTPALVEEDGADGWQGFDLGVIEAVADDLGLTVEFVPVDFDELVSGVALNSGRCDVGAGGVVAHEMLEAVATTSNSYRTVDRLVVTIGTGPQQAPDEVTGTIGVEDGGQAQDAAEALTGAQVVPYPSAMDLDRALDSGEVDAALVTFSGRDRLAADRDVTVLARIPIDDQTVLLFPLGADEELVDAADAALARLLDDGAYVELEERWLGR